MSGWMRGLKLAVVIAVVAAGACASDDDEDWDEATEATAPSGWQWVGEGEQQNFATADRFCRRTTVQSNPRLKTDARTQLSGADRGSRVSEGDRRAYWNCMESRGWRILASPTQPTNVESE